MIYVRNILPHRPVKYNIFRDNFENSVQEKFRKTTDSWETVLHRP
jgi:hypothetical protein